MNRLTMLAIAASALISGLLAYAVLQGGPAHSQAQAYEKLTALTDGRVLPDFQLINQDGEQFARDSFAGGWSVLFFGFTHCPDICPMTLYQLAEMQTALQKLPDDLRPAIYMVSVDVDRDTPEVMAKYVRAFNSAFVGLTGNAEELARLANALGVAYGTEPRPDGGYEVLHTSAVFILNDAGEFVAVSSAPHNPAVLARDYSRLVAGDSS